MAAMVTQLARLSEAVNHSVGYAIPLAFVGELTVEFSDSGIGYAGRKVMVTHHPFYVQVLYTDAAHLVFVSQPMCEFMQEVTPSMFDFRVNTGYAQLRLLVIGRSFLLAGKRTLQTGQPQ